MTVKQRTLVVTGTSKADKLTLRARGRFVVAGKKKVARRRFDEVHVRARSGNDRVRLRGRIGRATIEGGRGADTLSVNRPTRCICRPTARAPGSAARWRAWSSRSTSPPTR